MSTHTPWGAADHTERYVRGIIWYSTPSHGGFHVCNTLNQQIPEYMRDPGGWYEEDCDWAIVATVFPNAFLEHDKDPPKTFESARNTLRNWHPEAYEKFYGVELQPGESFKRDVKLFEDAHVNDLVTIAAWGDWHEKVPEGKVGVTATIGGKRGLAERCFLIPKHEYEALCKTTPASCGIVVDPALFEEIEQIR